MELSEKTMFCQCGCGTIISRLDAKGRKRRFVVGHVARVKKYAEMSNWVAPDKKICPACNKELDISNFYKKKYTSKTTGEVYFRIRPPCKQCEKLRINKGKSAEAKRKHRKKKKMGSDIRFWCSGRLASFRRVGSDLDTDYLEQLYKNQNGLCYYTKREMVFPVGMILSNGISLDRVDPNLGYVKGNVVFCQYSINTMKGRRTREEFLETIKLILEIASSEPEKPKPIDRQLPLGLGI